jgi:hypothetical protein
LDLFVPEGVAASITIDSGVSSVNVDEGRFPKAGDRYESPDFESAQNKLTLDIDVGAASLDLVVPEGVAASITVDSVR